MKKLITITLSVLLMNCGMSLAQEIGWTHPQYDLSGSYFYPIKSSIISDTIDEDWIFSDFSYSSSSILTGDVHGNEDLEIISVQDNNLYILSAEGNVELSQNIGISGQSFSYVTMLEDINNDGKLEIGILYARGTSNYGNGKARIYNGEGNILKEFTKIGNSDMFLEPITYLDGDIIIGEGSHYGKDPRGFSRWDYNTGNEIWYYDVGPSYNGYSIADINNDGLLELAYSNFSPHNGASGNGTTDGDNYTIIINEQGNEILTQKYSGGNSNGRLFDKFVKFDLYSSIYNIVSFKRYDSYYTGDSKVHIRNTDGTYLYNFTGLHNSTWSRGWADIDNDSIVEIITTNNGSSATLYVFDEQLNIQAALYNLPDPDYTFRAIADVNGDGSYEIIVSSSTDKEIIAYDKDVNILWSWSNLNIGNIGNVIVSDNNLDGKVDVCILTDSAIYMLSGNGTSSVNEINESNRINIYPNPFSIKTTIKFPNLNHSNYKFSIFNISGNKVFEMDNIKSDKIEFNKGNLPKGVYLIEVKGEKVLGGKMIVK
ncbi:MAG: T9SS type A sorting domain-containing protein [Bacteroidales bacterium]|nr:T9SS type A sorting domain-containing protein [Bacteroidales bacterium]